MNESVLIVADSSSPSPETTQEIDAQHVDIEKLFKSTKNYKQQTTFWVKTDEPKAYFKKITGKLQTIKAAGGLVKNGDGKYLFIYRLGKWDLPKGKIDTGEKKKKAAVREVEEECGIKVNYLGPRIATTYHLYTLRGELVIKATYWYEMAVNKSPALIPQTEEDITDAIWLSKKRLDKIKKNTYKLINDVLNKVFQ